MYARLLAFVCLFCSNALFGGSVAALASNSTLGVYLKADSSASLSYMRAELADLLAHGAVRQVQAFGRSAQVFGLRGSAERGEVLQRKTVE